ncbi:MAG: DNA glycosylase AlkZ-like family protein, partial [Vicinamibacterales bacterium]
MAIRRSFFTPTDLKGAIETFGFVQADPIRAPARAQDLTLRHRVRDYRAGDLEQQYVALGVEEDVFINYGFVSRTVYGLMHPRVALAHRPARTSTRERALLDFVSEHGEVHPRDVHAHFAHGTVTNYWGGSSNATTHLLDQMHYRGLLRVARRDGGIRVYTIHDHPLERIDAQARRARIDSLVDIAVRKYAPLPAPSLSVLIRRLRYGIPQWQGELTAALNRCRQRLARVRVGDLDWYWPAEEDLSQTDAPDKVRLLAPFDPVVWDRHRFELLWGWAYRFEAYTPEPKRKLGYYALPLLWRDRVIGWGNIGFESGVLDARMGYV